MKRSFRILFTLTVIGFLLAACAPAAQATSSATLAATVLSSSTQAPAILPSSTAAPATVETQYLASLPAPTNTSTPLPSPVPSFTPDPSAKIYKFPHISIAISSHLARSAASKTVPAVKSNKEAWLVAPQYDVVTLGGYPLPKGSYVTPELLIFPAQDYAAVNSGAKASLGRLQAILARPTSPLTNQTVPWLPFTPGEQSIAAQTKLISFTGGSGIRMVTQYDIFLDPIVTAPGDPIVNRLLFYHFEGLSADGTTYVIAILPLQIPVLANDPNPNAHVPQGGVPYPDLGVDISHFEYFKNITAKLNDAGAGDFQPSLDALDAMIMSIDVSQK